MVEKVKFRRSPLLKFWCLKHGSGITSFSAQRSAFAPVLSTNGEMKLLRSNHWQQDAFHGDALKQ